jgi:hypothetical protein
MGQETETQTETQQKTKQKRKAIIFHKVLKKVVLYGWLGLATIATAMLIALSIKLALGG